MSNELVVIQNEAYEILGTETELCKISRNEQI